MEIKVDDKGLEKALRTLKNRLRKEGVFREIKLKSYYEKPSEKSKRKRRESNRKKRKSRG